MTTAAKEPVKQFLINEDELKELSTSKNPEAKQTILFKVLARPYNKQDSLSMIMTGIWNLINDILDWVESQDKDQKPKQKNNTK